MNILPTKQGQSLYAAADGINVYHNPGLDSDKTGNFGTKGDLVFSKGSLLGTYTGERFGNFYEFNGNISIRVVPLFPKRNFTFTAWVLNTQVTTQSPSDVQDAQKAADDATFNDQLDKINGGGTSTTASSGTSTKSSNNMVLYIFGGLALLLGGAWLYMSRKKKPKPTAVVGNISATQTKK